MFFNDTITVNISWREHIMDDRDDKDGTFETLSPLLIYYFFSFFTNDWVYVYVQKRLNHCIGMNIYFISMNRKVYI